MANIHNSMQQILMEMKHQRKLFCCLTTAGQDKMKRGQRECSLSAFHLKTSMAAPDDRK